MFLPFLPRRGAAFAVGAFLLALAAPRWIVGLEPTGSGLPWGFSQQVAVNAEGDSYDSKPSLTVLPDGTTWMAWHAYRTGRDRVLARRIGPGTPGPIDTVSDGGTVHGPPVVTGDGQAGSAWVFWAARVDRRWRIVGRRVVDGRWQRAVTVSDPAADAILPCAAGLSQGRVIVSWCESSDGRFRVRSRVLDGAVDGPAVDVSEGAHDSFRSALAVDKDGTVWAFWDSYQDGNYSIRARPILPTPGPAEPISPPGQNCLTPAALGTESGLYVAWLQVADVIGGEGAITQWHTLHVAERRDEGWQPLCRAHGDSAAATLTHGLIARIEPEPVATGGYQGRRRAPMLLEDRGSLWLLWERKSDHRGRTPNVTGQLIGRRWSGAQWHEPAVLHEGLLDYHLAHPARTSNGRFLLAASDLPRNLRRRYHCLPVDVNVTSTFRQDDWPGWRPVKLPLDDGGPPQEIRDGDRVLRLYWGDLHCHTGLTADAEGEPDELLHYARDRAGLDVVVMTENDFIYDTFLTEYEFAMDHFLANRFTRPGRFVALPGFEWTSRLPRSPDVDRADPRNWNSQQWGASYPDHRTVIYPPAGGPVVRHPEVNNDIQRLYEAVEKAGGVTWTQHATWDLTGHPVELGVEVSAGWDIYIRNPERVHRALDQGHRFALVANGDSHRRNPGLCGALTGIYAEDLTPEAILDALRSRRVYATNGSRIVVESWANGRFMGREAEAPDGDAEISLSVIAPRPIVEAVLIRDGQEVNRFAGDGSRRLRAVHRDAGLTPGTHWYYWRVAQQGTSPRYPGNVKVARGHLAWSTPHWVVVNDRGRGVRKGGRKGRDVKGRKGDRHQIWAICAESDTVRPSTNPESDTVRPCTNR